MASRACWQTIGAHFRVPLWNACNLVANGWRFPQARRSDRPPQRRARFPIREGRSRQVCRCAQRGPEPPFAFTWGPVLAGT